MPKKKQNDETQQHKGQSVQEQQLQRKMTIKVKGQKRAYNYVKTVELIDELDNFRFTENTNRLISKRMCSKMLHSFKKVIMPCPRKRTKKKCKFELLAIFDEKKKINIYAHSAHNHPILSERIRNANKNQNKKKPLEEEIPPAAVYRTPDNIEWKFIQTFSDFDQLQKFRSESKCSIKTRVKKWRRIRYECQHRRPQNCEFMLLAMKTTSKRYHVYKHGEHNLLAHSSRTSQNEPRALHNQLVQMKEEHVGDPEHFIKRELLLDKLPEKTNVAEEEQPYQVKPEARSEFDADLPIVQMPQKTKFRRTRRHVKNRWVRPKKKAAAKPCRMSPLARKKKGHGRGQGRGKERKRGRKQ